MQGVAEDGNSCLTTPGTCESCPEWEQIGKGDNLKTLAEVERSHILAALRTMKGDKIKAAKALGIGKTTMYRKLALYEKQDKKRNRR